MMSNPDTPDLRTALARAASFGLRAGTDRALSTPTDGLRFFRDQVAGTLLGRRLTFRVDDAPRLECDVLACRLLRFAIMGDTGETLSEGRFDMQSESKQVDATLNTLTNALLAQCEEGAVIAVTSQPLSAARDCEKGGVDASRLDQAFGMSRDLRAALTPAEAIETFLAAAGHRVVASAHFNEDLLYPFSGEDKDIDALADLLKWILGAPDAEPGSSQCVLPVAGLRCLGFGSDAKHHLAVADVGGCRVFALIVPGSAPSLLRIWHDAVISS